MQNVQLKFNKQDTGRICQHNIIYLLHETWCWCIDYVMM